MKSKIFLLSALIVSSTLLASCSPKKPNYVISSAKTQANTPEAKLRTHHVYVIQQAARTKIILPTDRFFEQGSNQIKPRQVKALKMLAAYLKETVSKFNPQPKIRVYGYTDTVFTVKQQHQLSQQYAKIIASYLWSQGFSRQQLFVVGKGAQDTIANDKTVDGKAFNRRVVIAIN